MATAAPSGPPTAAAPSSDAPELRLKRGEDRRLRAGHLWIFSNEVDTAATPLTRFARGAPARVVSERGQFVGHAYVNPNALICARLVSRDVARPVDRALLAERLRAALALRERLSGAPWYRLAFGESDGLPGLVLDRYGELLVGQIATAGMEAIKADIVGAVRDVIAPSALVWKNDTSARELEHLERRVEVAFGEAPEELEVREGRLRFLAPLAAGQKTGWFYDQTANRAQLARLLWPGARVLDVCSYVGAWAVTALAAGASAATCVDTSAAALDFAARNARANGFEAGSTPAARPSPDAGPTGMASAGTAPTLSLERGDAFEALRALHESGRRFDVVILDPPAFIKRKKDLPQGQAAYRKLNQLALALIEGDGLLVSCSCSYHLAADDLVGLIQHAARSSRRFVQILASGSQSPDHPVHPAIPETRYLKAFFCRVLTERG